MKYQRTTLRKNRGLSLIELMVAIVIGLILTAGLVQIVVSNKSNYEILDDMAKLQENARFALEFMTRDLRMAGFYGCADDPSALTNILPVSSSGLMWDTTFPVEGFDPEISTTQWQPSAYTGTNFPTSPATSVTSNSAQCAGTTVGSRCTGATAAAGSDMITMRHIVGNASQSVSSANLTSVTIPIGSGFQPWQFAAIYDCSTTDIVFIGTAVDNTSDGTTTLTFYPGSGNTLSKVYSSENNTRIAPIRFVRYYVGTGKGRTTSIGGTATGGPALFRRQLSNNPTSGDPTSGSANLNSYELIPGVENMQVRYGVDVDSDGMPDEYLRAGENGTTADLRSTNSDEWFNVVTMRIGLLLRTEDEFGDEIDSTARVLNGTSIGAPSPSDRRRRRTFTTTVRLRNFQ